MEPKPTHNSFLALVRVNGVIYVMNRRTTIMSVLKRIADWLEKSSVAAFAVGIFQNQLLLGLSAALIFLIGSLALTIKIEKETGGK